MSAPDSPFLNRFLEVISNIKPNEQKATLLSFVMAFTLMASYFLLRPVRDAMASDWSDAEVSYLWNLQFFISIAIVSAYGYLVSKIRFSSVVPLVYGVFAGSFVLFYFLTPMMAEPTFIEKAFYVWVSAFSLFHLSVFWSLMSNTFSKEQGKRLFAVIAAGASAGAIFGPIIPAFFANELGIEVLMLIAACGLLLVIPMILVLYQLKDKQLYIGGDLDDLSEDSQTAISSTQWWSGFKDFVANPYLLGIGAFLLLYVFIGSFVYFEQKNLLAEFTRTERAQILGRIDWLVNTLTFVMAFFVTGRIVTRLGMPVTLALLPILLVLGMLALALAPLVLVVMSIQVARRAGNYAVTRPAREMLFSQVSQDERFKAKPVIDIVVYRGGDAASGSLFALLSEGLGVGLAAIALIGAALSALWATVALRLGYQYEKPFSTAVNDVPYSRSLSTTSNP